MAKNTLKILRCEHRKNLKVCLEILNVMNERMMLHNVLNFVLQADAYLGSYQIYMMELLSS